MIPEYSEDAFRNDRKRARINTALHYSWVVPAAYGIGLLMGYGFRLAALAGGMQ